MVKNSFARIGWNIFRTSLVESIKMLNISFLLHLFPIVHHHHHHGAHLIGEAHWSAGDPKHGSTGVPGSNDLIIKIKTSNYL